MATVDLSSSSSLRGMLFSKDAIYQYKNHSMKENTSLLHNVAETPFEGGSCTWVKAKRPLDVDSIPTPFMKSRRLLTSSDSVTKPPEPDFTLPEKASTADFEVSHEQSVAGRRLKVAGPEKIETLRGHLLGREVAIVFCGEAHQDAIDLTRPHSKVEAEQGWVEMCADGTGFNSVDAFAKKENLTLPSAKRWASKALNELGNDQSSTGAVLVFDTARAGYAKARGTAHVFLPGTNRHSQYTMPCSASVFEWGDLDKQARIFNQRRANIETRMSVEEQDALIENRKLACLSEGIELFDDWLIRHANSQNMHVNLILEAPISADEVELHVEENASPAPLADKQLREIEPDSDEDSDQAENLCNGSYLDTIRRRAAKDMPRDRVHCIDPRLLGDADDENLPKALQGSFKVLAQSPLTKDSEEALLEKLGESCCDDSNDEAAPPPSWEAFFGGAADLLYYSPHIKADYTPFLTNCVGSADKLKSFFQNLFFGTVPQALAEIQINEGTRPSAAIRSDLCQAKTPNAVAVRRHNGKCRSGRATIPVKVAPVDRYLKARDSNPPRTWISGLVQRLRNAGAENLVAAAQKWYMGIVSKVLNDPKGADSEGDNFGAWLRAAHRDIYDDIDRCDFPKLQRATWAWSKKHPKSKEQRYNLKNIKIPGLEEAFEEFYQSRSLSQPSSRRQQVLSQIIVDSFSLRSVDLSMVLKTADVATSAPEGARVVVVIYAGLDHTRSVAKFWRSQGFSHGSLPNKGVVGKEYYDDDEARCLKLPSYLHDLSKLFPIPTRTSQKQRDAQPMKAPKIRSMASYNRMSDSRNRSKGGSQKTCQR